MRLHWHWLPSMHTAQCTMPNAHRAVIINFSDRQRDWSAFNMHAGNTIHKTNAHALQCSVWLRLVISIPSHKIKWLWLIGWFRCSCSVHDLRMFSATIGELELEEELLVTLESWVLANALPGCQSVFRVVEQIRFFYCYLICHLTIGAADDRPIASFLLQTLAWWLINFSMICMRCVCRRIAVTAVTILALHCYFSFADNKLFENSELSRWSDFTWMSRCSFARWLVKILILVRARTACTQRSPSAQRINYSLRKSLLCMEFHSTVDRFCLSSVSITIWCVCVCVHIDPGSGAWLLFNRLLQHKNAIRSS